MILPYARSFCRLVGSQYNARDFISGDTKLKFQTEFEAKLREACAKQGIEVLQALVRDIEPPEQIKQPINEREDRQAADPRSSSRSRSPRARRTWRRRSETATQNQKIGEANKQVVTIVKKAEQERDVAITKAKQDLAVAKLRLEAAQKEADAMVAKGRPRRTSSCSTSRPRPSRCGSRSKPSATATPTPATSSIRRSRRR